TQFSKALNVELGSTAPLKHIRQTVLRLRASKSRVFDAADYDTWSTGSFVINPIVPVTIAATLPENAPRFAHARCNGKCKMIKISAALLIEQARYHQGFGLNGEPDTTGRAGLSTKHNLALTNRGDATAKYLIHIATLVRDGVERQWGITLVPEPVLVGIQLGD